MWTVTPNEVLKRWLPSSDEKPLDTDELLVTLTGDSIVVINSEISDLDSRIDSESNLLPLLKIQVSTMVQRAWNSDYSNFTSRSSGMGPFSEGFSKSEKAKQGIFMTPEEISKFTKASEFGGPISTDPNRANFRIGC
jgi:hypothetical protein